MKRCVHAASLAGIMATSLVHAGDNLLAAPTEVCGNDMKVLVLSADGTEANLPAITTTLDYLGTPYTVYIARQTRGGLTAGFLASGCHANYQAVIVTTGAVDNVWSGVLSVTELQALHTFESQYKVRQVVWYTFPNDFGLTFTGTTVNTIGQKALPVTLTPAGAAVFPYINLGPQKAMVGTTTVTVGNPARPLVIEQATVYIARPDAAAATTPLSTATRTAFRRSCSAMVSSTGRRMGCSSANAGST